MNRLAWLALSMQLAFATVAHAAPDGRPAHPKSIGLWSHHDPDPNRTRGNLEPWTASDVVGFLALYPDAYVDASWGDGKGPGLTSNVRLKNLTNEAQAIAKQRGVNIDRRMCLSERPDVYMRLHDTLVSCHPTRGGGGCDWEGNMDGRFGEAETVVKTSGEVTGGDETHIVDSSASWEPEFYRHRLVVLRPGAGEERRRVTANDGTVLSVDAPWSSPPQPGDRYEIRGSFDPAWVMAVPRSVHQSTMTRFWEGARARCANGPCAPAPEPLDPFAPANRRGWEPWVSRTGIQALATPSTVPALYGYGYDANKIVDYYDFGHAWTDPYFRASSVVMDLRNPAYRAWRIRSLMYKLPEFGFDPGEPACLLVAYKPGYHTYYDESTYGPPTPRCGTTGTNNWFGPVHMCRDGTSFGGPMHPTQYGPGEFESAISAYFRELLSALAAAGRGDTRVITAEAPQFRDSDWTTLAEDVRFHPKMREQQGGWIEPKLAQLQAAANGGGGPGDGGAPIGGGTDGGPPADAGASGDTGGSIDSPSDDAPTGADFDDVGSGGSGADDTPAPRAAPRAPSDGSSPAPAASPRTRPERRGFMASGGSGGGGTVEAPSRD